VRHGKPLAFYSDKANIFRVNARDSAEGRGYTQIGRALFELNIDILCANSSPAWSTLPTAKPTGFTAYRASSLPATTKHGEHATFGPQRFVGRF